MGKTFIADQNTATAMTEAFFGWRFKQPRTYLIYVLAAAIPLLLVRSVSRLTFALIFVLVLVVFSEVNVFLGTRRMFAQNIAKPGNKVTAELSSGQLSIKTDQGSSTSEFSAYRSISVGPTFVFLRIRSKIVIVLPRQLLSDTDWRRLGDAISGSVVG